LTGSLRRQDWELCGRGTWAYLKGWDRRVLVAPSLGSQGRKREDNSKY